MEEKFENQNKDIDKIEEKIVTDLLRRIKNKEFSLFSDKLEEIIIEQVEKENYIPKDWHQYYAKERIKEKIEKKLYEKIKYKYNIATRLKRFLNFLLDYIGLVIMIIFFDLFFLAENTYGLSVIITIVYYLLFESVWSKTPAKFITKTKVIMENGEKPPFGVIFIRTLIRFVPFEIFSFLSPERPRGWHDRWSKTIVVDDIKKKVFNNQDPAGFYCSHCGSKLDSDSKFCHKCGKKIIC
jgi:uncharacterized RDD family membrane protein YckC